MAIAQVSTDLPISISASEIASTPTHSEATVQTVVEFLIKLGLPALPVAPTQDPYLNGQHKESKGDGSRAWAHCPLTKNFEPEPLYTGKNPSFLQANRQPKLIKHQNYQNHLPSQRELASWWQNPTNGVGTLGGWGEYIWLDFDVKQFDSQAECDRAFDNLLETHPHLRESWIEQTHSGGYRLAVKPKQPPTFTNFALAPGGRHRGEALGKGRFTVLAPTIGPSGNPYRCLNRAIPVEIESLAAIGIFPVGKQSELVSRPQRPAARAGAIALEQLGNKAASAVLQGDNPKGDRSDSLTTAYREWCGWERWAQDQGIALNDTAEDLAYQASEALGIDADRVARIIKKIDPAQCQPAALHRGGEEACWRRVRKLDRPTFESLAPQSVRESLETLYRKTGASEDRSSNWGNGGNSGSGGNGGNSGNDNPPFDDRNPDNPFRETCRDLNLPFEYCVTRQQFDGAAYRVLFGGETGDWIVINSAFYHWNGKHWQHKSETRINKLIADFGEKAFKLHADNNGNPYITRPYENNKHKESAFKYCRSRLERETLITNHHLLAFNDRVVDLRTGATLPHDKAFLLTQMIPHDYEPGSDCPEVFLNFVLESFGEDQLAKIRAYTSAFLDPTAPYGRVPHLIGQSGGGKGTLGRFWNSLLGEEASGSSTAFSDLSTPEGRHQHLTGKRIFGFPDVGGFMQGLRAFYELVDNGAMTGRALFNSVAYQKTWNCRFWIGSVSHLQIENAGDGWGRRADPIAVIDRLVIPDPNLGTKLQAVKAQVIAWALAMPRGERDAILLSPPTSDRAKSLVRDAALYGDSTKSFVDLCLRPSADSTETVSHAQIHTLYEAYCQQHGYTPLGLTKFISHLRTVLPYNYAERGWSPMIDGARDRIPAHWKGIRPVSEVFVSSNVGDAQFAQNPQWVCLKAKCLEGGLEEFENYWNPDLTVPKMPEPLHNEAVQSVQPQNPENQGVDSLNSLHSAGVQGGSTVHSESVDLNSKLQSNLTSQLDSANLTLSTPVGQTGQGGQADSEAVSANSVNLDSVDRMDNSDLLPLERLTQAVQALKAVDSLEAFKQFYHRYQNSPQTHQKQIVLACDDVTQVQFYAWLDKLYTGA